MVHLEELRKELRSNSNPEKAKQLQRYFKTGKGEYGEGDIFIGIQVPHLRAIVKKYKELDFKEIEQLLASKIHEERMAALMVLLAQFKKAKKDERKQMQIYEFYLGHTSGINNWDLVDLSCVSIVGGYLFRQDKSILKMLAKSDNIWERRIAIVSTAEFIRRKRFGETLAISEMLMGDTHDLIHKAVGWMLREVGKKDVEVLELFLASHYKEMPRTMLRYAIEKFPEEKRKAYLGGLI